MKYFVEITLRCRVIEWAVKNRRKAVQVGPVPWPDTWFCTLGHCRTIDCKLSPTFKKNNYFWTAVLKTLNLCCRACCIRKLVLAHKIRLLCFLFCRLVDWCLVGSLKSALAGVFVLWMSVNAVSQPPCFFLWRAGFIIKHLPALHFFHKDFKWY